MAGMQSALCCPQHFAICRLSNINLPVPAANTSEHVDGESTPVVRIIGRNFSFYFQNKAF